VQEGKFRVCHFDNFVWLSDDEINARLKKELPLYNGVAPETGALLDEIPGVLEALSKEKGVAVRVSRRVQQNAIGDPNWSHMYVAEGADVKVQSVRFAGSISVSADELQKVVARMVGSGYSAFESALMGSRSIQPFFSERGYLRATVETLAMKITSHADATSQFAVELLYTVTQGELFYWKPAEWKGDATLPAADLDALTGMKPNDVANAKKIDEGWFAVKNAYAKHGFMEAHISPEAVFDDASPLVHYRVTITEGPQYHMGTFAVTGAPAKIAERLAERWKLKPGDAFDGGYPLEFANKEAAPSLRGVFTRPPKLGISTVPNRAQHTVDVTLKVE
jgi:outer membrane protein assembly factor BamA